MIFYIKLYYMATLSKSMKSVKSATKSINKNVNNLFSNKYFLYLMLFLAITSVLGYLQVHNFQAIVFFILVGFLTYYFTKNMSVVLLTAIVATAFYSKLQKNMVEGLENKKDDNDDGEEGMGHEEGMTEEEDEDDNEEGMSSKIDYKKTLTDSYDNLNKMIGGEGMQRMTQDTEKLMKTQKQLAKNMENMKPMLENAQSMIKGMGNLDIKGLGDMMNNLGGLGKLRGKTN